MSNEKDEIISNPSAQSEVQKLPSIPNVSIGLTVLLLDDFQYEGYERHISLRSEDESETEDFWTLEHFEDSESNRVICLYNDKQRRVLKSIIFDESSRTIREIKISDTSREVTTLYSLHKDEHGNWI